MSPKNSLLATGLSALGLFGFAPFGVADPPAAPQGTSAPVAPSPSRAVLLLTNGNVVQGLISEDETSYFQHRSGGKIPYSKRKVEKAFGTLEEAYQYQLERLAERDPDEHLKLARWCLTNRLNTEAKAELSTVLALSPGHRQAKEMLDKINGAEDRVMFRDANITQARAETVEGQMERPDPAILNRAVRELGGSTLPQIPGLPPDMAVKRTNEFARIVHPVLQKYCARCHGELYPGNFRLIPFKTKHNQTPDALRANLDATIRLVDFNDPTKSELLSSTLRPHGVSSTKRAIFGGSNDPGYRILAAWVNNLRASRPPGAVQPSRFGGPQEVVSEEGFATQRAGAIPLPLTPTPTYGARPQPPSAPNPVTPLPPGQFVHDSGTGVQPYAPANAEFPAPYLLGGPKPKLDPASRNAGSPEIPLPKGATRASAAPDGSLPPLPETDETDDIPLPKTRRKPVKLDPELLQKALMNRFAPPQ